MFYNLTSIPINAHSIPAGLHACGDHSHHFQEVKETTQEEYPNGFSFYFNTHEEWNTQYPAVIKWEKAGNKPSKMNLIAQRGLLLWLLDQLLIRDEDFRQAFKNKYALEFDISIERLCSI